MTGQKAGKGDEKERRDGYSKCGGQIKTWTDGQTKSGIIRQHNVWCPTAEEMCKSKGIAGNDALKLFMVPVSLQLKSDNPYPGLNEGLFFHRSFCPSILKDFSLGELLYSLPLCSFATLKDHYTITFLFFSFLIFVTVIE